MHETDGGHAEHGGQAQERQGKALDSIEDIARTFESRGYGPQGAFSVNGSRYDELSALRAARRSEKRRTPKTEHGQPGAESGTAASSASYAGISGNSRAGAEPRAVHSANARQTQGQGGHPAGYAHQQSDSAPASASSGSLEGFAPSALTVPAASAPFPEEAAKPGDWDDALWEACFPEARQKVGAQSRAMADSARALAAKQEAYLHLARTADALLRQASERMRFACERDFAGIDWDGLSRTDPARYVRLQQERQTRFRELKQTMDEADAQRRAFEQAQSAEAARALHEERAAVLPRLKALLGEPVGDSYRREIAGYLHSCGMPAHAIGAISKGYEVELAAKAMLFDRMDESRARAAAKVAGAPGVQAPGRAARAHGRREQARARLLKEPGSTEALAALFDTL